MRTQLQLGGAAAVVCVVIGLGLTWSSAAPARSAWSAPPAPGRAPQFTPTPACGLGAWAVVSPIPEAAAAIGVAGDGQVAYAAGGLSGGAVLGRFAHYDPATGAWGLLAPLPTAADGIGLVTVPGRSQILALGGADSAGNSLSTMQVYNTATNSWSLGVPLPGPRSRAATVYANNAIYLIGGGTTRDPASGQTQTWQFDLASSTWNVSRAPLPAARVSPGYGVVNGHVYVIGGRDVSGAAVNTVYDYDVAADTWTTRAALPVAVAGPAGAVAAGQIVLAGGGTPLLGAAAPAAQVPLSTTVTQIFDPAANAWSTGPPLTVGRAYLGGTAAGGYLIAVGGSDSVGTVYSTTEVSPLLGPCPAATPTATPTPAPPTPIATSSPTVTGSATPTASLTPSGPCYTYTITAGPGRLLPGSHDIGNHCDDCTTDITIPFFVPLYDGPPLGGPAGPPIMKGRLSANGYGTFSVPTPTPGAAPAGKDNSCLPAPGFTYTIFPHWDDQRTDCAGCGIFTATVGCEPDRTFIIEWRTGYVAGGGTADFALELHEESSTFDVVYGPIAQGGAGATVGLQRDPGTANQYECNSGGLSDGLRLTFTRSACGLPATTTATPPATPAASATPTACAIQFSDVPVGNPFYAPIRCLACRGILSGYADGTFRPGNPVTRGQMAKIIANSAAFAACIPLQQQTFADVPPAHPFWVYIERVALYQVVSGYTCGGPGEPCDPLGRPYYRPFNNLTRGQMAKIAANAANYHETVPATQQTFADVPPNTTYWVYVERLHNRGIVSGYACGGPGEPCDPLQRPYYRPFGNVTRGQTAKIAANTFYPNCQAVSRQPSAVSRQPSAVSHQPSAVSGNKAG